MTGYFASHIETIGSTGVNTDYNIEVRNDHSVPDGTALFRVPAKGWMIAGKPTLRQFLRFWWHNGRRL